MGRYSGRRDRSAVRFHPEPVDSGGDTLSRSGSRPAAGSPPVAEGEEPDPRWSLANERTVLAYMRTASRFWCAGLAVAASETFTRAPTWLAALGLPLLGMAAVVSVSARERFLTVQRAMRLGEPLRMPPVLSVLPWGIASVAVLGLVLTGIALASS